LLPEEKVDLFSLLERVKNCFKSWYYAWRAIISQAQAKHHSCTPGQYLDLEIPQADER